MATIDAAIPAGADDVAYDDNGFDIANGYPVLGLAGATDCIYAFRVPVSGLQGATITAAWINDVIQANGGSVSPTLAIYAEDAASPARITSLTDLNGRTRTTAKVDWDTAWTGYNTKDSPSLVSIIQELADTYNPDYIQIFIQNDGGSAGVQVYAYEGGYPPTLHIEYTPAAAGITGTLSATLAAITLSATAAAAIAAALNETLSVLGLTTAGAVGVSGQVTDNIAPPSLSATGAVGVSATLTATLPMPALVASGTVTTASVHGTLSASVAEFILVATARVAVKGALNTTLSALILTAIAGIVEPTIPEDRVLHVAGDNRRLRVGGEDRALYVEEDSRLLRVQGDNRELKIRPDNRVMRIER